MNLRDNKEEITKKVQSLISGWTPDSVYKFSEDYIQVIDFFSGCGGMSLGFAAFNEFKPLFKLIGGCDINKDAANSYQKNFNVPCITQDISELIEDSELNIFINNLPFYDRKKPLLVIGCPPCQGFTSHRKKNWENKDNRNNLVGIFAEVAVKLNPDCIVMENVPEMLSKKYWDYYQSAVEVFNKAGYIVHQNIYNAAAFGVPQERHRTLVMAMKKDFLLPETLLLPANYRTVREAIGHLPPVDAGEVFVKDAYHKSAKHKQSTLDVIKAVPKNGGNRPKGVGPKCLDKVKGYTDVYGRLSWNKPSITITQYARNPASGRYTHPEQNRGLTIREASILQSFPKPFQFTGTFDAMFKQIGEAVPPLFACAVAVNAYIELLSEPLKVGESKQHNKYIKEPINNSYAAYSKLTAGTVNI